MKLDTSYNASIFFPFYLPIRDSFCPRPSTLFVFLSEESSVAARALAKARIRLETHVSNALTRPSFLSIHRQVRIRMHILPVRTPDLGERRCVR